MPRQKLLSEKEKLERKRASYHRWYQRNKEIRRASQKRWLQANKGSVEMSNVECFSPMGANITSSNVIFGNIQNDSASMQENINTIRQCTVDYSNLTPVDILDKLQIPRDSNCLNGNYTSYGVDFINDVDKSDIVYTPEEKNVILECSRCYALSSISGIGAAHLTRCHHRKIDMSLKSDCPSDSKENLSADNKVLQNDVN